ncbi:V-type ATP synthase subunit D [Patescibacteria group bacterium]|nr:V-type ATP synthase subunit D [Patescibacteria group bacterium]
MEKIKPTRIELIKLKIRLKTSQRGHKLLKEKRDGLMKKFMEIIKEAKVKRIEMEEKLSNSGKDFAIISSPFSPKEVEQFFLLPSMKAEVSMEEKNIMGVKIPVFSCQTYKIEPDEKSYSYFSFPIGMEKSIKEFENTFSLMLELANIEHSARLLSFEIEKTRRRVNALEYIIIPQIIQNIKLIRSKLDENERAEKIIRLIIKSQIA